jgi:hypothetical protein
MLFASRHFQKIYDGWLIAWRQIKAIFAIPAVRWFVSLVIIFLLLGEAIKYGLSKTKALGDQTNLISYSLAGIATAAIFFLGRNSYMLREGKIFNLILLGLLVWALLKIYKKVSAYI